MRMALPARVRPALRAMRRMVLENMVRVFGGLTWSRWVEVTWNVRVRERDISTQRISWFVIEAEDK